MIGADLFAGLGLGLLVALGLALARLLRGPSAHDRALGAHAVLLIAALACAVLAAAARRPAWLDLTIGFALADLIVMIAVLKVFRTRTLQTALSRLIAPAGSEEAG